jgi:hypothetical protein
MTTPSDRIDLKRVLVVHESCDRGCLILVVACGPEMPHQVFKRSVSSAEVPVTARLVGIHPNAAGEQANRELNQGAAVGISPETHQCGNRQPLAAFMPVPLADLGIELGERQFPSSRQIPIVLQPGERCLRLGPLIGLERFDAGAESIRCERAAQRGERRPRVVADKDVVIGERRRHERYVISVAAPSQAQDRRGANPTVTVGCQLSERRLRGGIINPRQQGQCQARGLAILERGFRCCPGEAAHKLTLCLAAPTRSTRHVPQCRISALNAPNRHISSHRHPQLIA